VQLLRGVCMEYVGEHIDIPLELLGNAQQLNNITVSGDYEITYDFTPLIENEVREDE